MSEPPPLLFRNATATPTTRSNPDLVCIAVSGQMVVPGSQELLPWLQGSLARRGSSCRDYCPWAIASRLRVYARANRQTMQRAFESVAAPAVRRSPCWKREIGLIEWLESLW